MKRSRQSEEGIDQKRVKNDVSEQSEAQAEQKVERSIVNDENTEPDALKDVKSQPSKNAQSPIKEQKEATVNEQSTEKKDTQNSDSKTTQSEAPTAKDTQSKEENNESKKEADTKTETKESDKKQPSEASKPAGFSAFGSGFSGFGGFSGSGFSARAKSSNPWAEPSGSKDKEPSTSEESKGNEKAQSDEKPKENAEKASETKEPSPETDTFATVKLNKQEVKTGEEDEEAIFQIRVRLYAIDLTETEQKSWKERGTGLLKLNRFEGSEKFRLVMRADGVLRVSLNIPVDKNMQLTKGFPTSLHTERFVKFTGFEEGKLHQYAVRCGSESQRDELFDSINSAFEK